MSFFFLLSHSHTHTHTHTHTVIYTLSSSSGPSLPLSLSAVCHLSPLSISVSGFTGWMNPSALKLLLEAARVCSCVCLCSGFMSLCSVCVMSPVWLTSLSWRAPVCVRVMRHCNLGGCCVRLRRRISCSLLFPLCWGSELFVSLSDTFASLFLHLLDVWRVFFFGMERCSSSLAASLLPPLVSWQRQKSHHSFTVGCCHAG